MPSLQRQSLRHSTIIYALAVVALAAAIWLPRGLALDRFITADEHAWLARSGNFYRAVAHGDWAETFQRHHPGVTVTWAGAAGFGGRYPAYAADAPGSFGWLTEEIESFLRAHGHDPVELLAVGRAVVVLLITVALLLAFWMAIPLLGWSSALVGFGLIAFAPFHMGLSRLLHLDGLLSSFMLLSVLAFLNYLAGGRRHALVISGVAAGLAWLTRSPGLFLVPFLGLVALMAYVRFSVFDFRKPFQRDGSPLNRTSNRTSKSANAHSLLSLVMALIVWCVIGLIVFVLFWPAMWVDPVGSLRQVLSAAGEYAAEGHLKPTFFNGEVYGGDPGFFFYPITYLWRTTPMTLLGLALALIAFLLRRAPLAAPVPRGVALILLLYALLFALFMNIGAKKFDRYLLPAYLPLELVAGLGWVAAGGWLSGVRGDGTDAATFVNRKSKIVFTLVGATVILIQAALALPQFPYYLTYYNPLLGGGGRAPEVMMIGWGEGADRAARFLAQEPNAADATVASAYTNGPFSYFYPGETWPIYFWHDADYAVLYAQDRQRRLPAPRQIAYFEGLTPLHTVRLNNIDYAWIYDLQDAPLPAYVTDWQTADSAAPQIRLVSYQFPASVVQPGETLNTILYFVNSAPIAENLNVIVRLVGSDGTEVAREEGWPWGAATSTWPLGDVWPDGHALSIPPDATPGIYRLDVAFNNPAVGELLTATQPSTGQVLGEFVALDFVRVGHAQNEPAVPLQPVADLGGLVALEGVTWRDGTGTQPSEPLAVPGQPVTVELAWRGLAPMRVDYTTFVHVVGPDGQALTQQDGQPLGGFFPTSYWQPGHAVVDGVTLDVPADAAPGAYAVHVGMYDLATMQRLPITRDGTPAGDSVVVGELIVGDSRE